MREEEVCLYFGVGMIVSIFRIPRSSVLGGWWFSVSDEELVFWLVILERCEAGKYREEV